MKFLIFWTIFATFLYAKPVVTTSILPTAFFVKSIAGQSLEINTMVRANADPHSYEPRAEQMKMLEKSDIFFAVGLEYEGVWLPKFRSAFPKLKIINTAPEGPEQELEQGPEHEHDTHIWLDPIMVKSQAKIIEEVLSQSYPQNAELYATNLDSFLKEIDELDGFIKESLSGLKNRKFMVFHPSWTHFAKRYELEQIAIESGGKEPKPAALANLIKVAKSEDIRVIFVSKEFSKKAAELIAKESGAKVMEIDHLPSQWLESMREVALIFKNLL